MCTLDRFYKAPGIRPLDRVLFKNDVTISICFFFCHKFQVGALICTILISTKPAPKHSEGVITLIFSDFVDPQVPLEDAMGKLIVYCRSVPYKKNEVSGDCCEMYSFNDGAAQDSISAHPRGMRNR